jgi:Tfp pilus assembly protein PilF/lysophospholipase L1-like esterase
LAAVGIPAVLLLGLEFGLRLAGFGRSASFLIPDDQPGYYRPNPDFVSLFLPSTFDLRPLNFRVAARKAPDTLRVVVLGESAAQGVPEPVFGFAPQLRALLRAQHPGKNIEVINTGIVAINSHVVYQIARDLAEFSPDLFVVYLGNNEVVGPYGPGCSYLSEMPPLSLIRLSVFARSTRTGQLIGGWLSRLTSHRAPPAEWGGMAMFVESAVRGDDPRLEQVYRNFEANLEGIVRTASSAGAKSLLCTVVSNLKDCAPLLSLHRPGLTLAESAAWEKSFGAGRLEWLLGEDAAAKTNLEEALRLDPQYADTHFMLGAIEWRAGNGAAARKHFLAAQHWDALRFRPDPRLNELTREVARRHGGAASLVDTAVLLGSDPASDAPPTGRELFFEHVHPDWEGNYRIALALARGVEAILASGKPAPAAWLDSAGCAAAVGYTPHARSSVLQQVATIIQQPPFTNQLTYPEDMARFARELSRAEADRANPEIQNRAWVTVQAAMQHDPENPHLAKIAADLAEDRGDLSNALLQARRARQLQPEYFRLAAGEAIKLLRSGRFDDAEKLLRRTAATCAPRDLVTIAPAFVYLYNRTKRFAEGRRTLDDFLTRRPGDRKLMLLRGRLANFAGDSAAAEQDFRAILAQDPGDQETLEALVTLLHTKGRKDAAEQESLAAASHQPRNQANNLRAALISENRGNEADAAKFLLAAERCGPVTAGAELQLARKLYGLRQRDESLLHLAWARRLSEYEGDRFVTQSITEFIAQLRANAN